MISVFSAKITPLEDTEVFSACFEEVKDIRKEKINSLNRIQDRRLSLGAGLLLKHAFARCGLDYEAAEFYNDENGKPHVKGDDVFFSLSHSGDTVLVSLSDKIVGCDVELACEYKEAVAKRFYHPLEVSHLEKITDAEDKRLEFYRIWTAKESFVKAIGQGFRISPVSFAAIPSPHCPVVQTVTDKQLFVKSFSLDAAYICSVCSEYSDTPDITELSFRSGKNNRQ